VNKDIQFWSGSGSRHCADLARLSRAMLAAVREMKLAELIRGRAYGQGDRAAPSLTTAAWAKITGGRGTSPPELGVGERKCKLSPRLRHVSEFQAQDCLHYNAVVQ